MSDKVDPRKFHVLTKKQKILILLGTLIFIFIVLPPLGYLYYNFALNRPSQTDKEITFEVKKGQVVYEIADNLYDAGAINSKFLFNFYAKSTKLDRNIQAGLYTIDAGSTIKDLVIQLQHGTLDKSITFIEGWRIEEFARKASLEFMNVDYYEFLTLAKGLEGYLFPDTYVFNDHITTKEMIKNLVDVFDQKVGDLLSNEYLEKSGLTAEQAVIFASIVERETYDEDDRPVVAGILIKRWKEGMKIEADATTQYMVANMTNPCNNIDLVCDVNKNGFENIDWWSRDLTRAQLNTDSPYNTRANVGLPPAPISSISLSALTAVVNYVDSDYYFYINDSTGKTHFGVTLADHEANIARYLNN